MSTVMIAENEEATRKKLEKLLTDEDFSVTSVSEAGEVVRRVINVKPDVMLLDAAMLRLRAKDLSKRLGERGMSTSLIMITERNGNVPRSLEPHVTASIMKPVTAKEVRTKVHQALARIRALRESRTPRLYVPLAELHDSESGRIDAKKVAEFLGVDLTELAGALDANYQTVYKTPDAPALQAKLRPIKRSLELVSRATLSGSDARVWLNNPHPDLGERTPLDVIMTGESAALVTLLENALSGIPS